MLRRRRGRDDEKEEEGAREEEEELDDSDVKLISCGRECEFVDVHVDVTSE